MTRGATLFSGGGGVEARLKDCIEFVHAVEYDPAIAAVYRINHGDHVQVASVCDVDYAPWGALDYLHASPVCKNASQAKTGGEESDTDIQTAMAVVRCMEATQPRVFTLENVAGYRNFQAYRRICQALDRGGYMWHAEVLNAADYGVPQTRRRLILRAVKDALLPGWPAPLPWIGWFESVEDLIPELIESTFTQRIYDLAKLIGGIPMLTLVDCQHSNPEREENAGRTLNYRLANEPAQTLLSSGHASRFRTILENWRIVQMNIQAIARFQSLPDCYQHPASGELAATVIGNMVPSLLMREIVRPLL